MDTALTSSLSGIIVAGAYFLYKFVLQKHCRTRSECTEGGIDLHITTAIESHLESKKEEMLQSVIDKLNEKLEATPLQGIQLSPPHATAPVSSAEASSV